ncbi:MAG: VF530 family DNA-binding protein [Burkholderiales bacterium]
MVTQTREKPQTLPMPAPASRDPLHGITLERMLTELVAQHGWPELGRRIPIRCFVFEPSIKSSLAFLRRTPWAREKVEELYRADSA